MEWWARMLPVRHFITAAEVELYWASQEDNVGSAPRRMAEAVTAGTDTSGWGTGQLCLLDGQRSELQFGVHSGRAAAPD